MELSRDGISVEVDEGRGVISSVRDPLERGGANYLAGKAVAYRSELGAEDLFLGDVVIRTWFAGLWALAPRRGPAIYARLPLWKRPPRLGGRVPCHT